MRRWYDPLYGPCELSEFEYALIGAPEVQRLRYVRMCNINSLLVTGASEISRFEHSLGVLRVAQEWLSTRQLPAKLDRAVRAAALLHDVLTAPFGHSLQYVLEDNAVPGQFAHDDINRSRIENYYQRAKANVTFAGRQFTSRKVLGTDWDTVASLVKGEGEFGPLIAGTVDFDNIDNVVRLAYHVGLVRENNRLLPLRLARDLSIGAGALELSEASLLDVEAWQGIRRHLYELLLLDWAEFSAKAMLTRIVEDAVEASLLGADSWRFTDLELLYEIERQAKGDAQHIGELSRRLRAGELYHPVALWESDEVGAYHRLSAIPEKRAIESALADFCRKRLHRKLRIIFHPILDSRKTMRSVSVRVRETGEMVRIGADTKRILLGLFLSTPLPERDLYALHQALAEAIRKLGIDRHSELPDPMRPNGSQPRLF